MNVRTKQIIYIPNGSIDKIITQLKHNNNNITKLDSYVLRLFGLPQHGWIDLNSTDLTKADFLFAISHAKAAKCNITLIPGETTVMFLKQLSKQLHLNDDKLQIFYRHYAYEPEGILMPNTYSIPMGINAKSLVLLLLHESDIQMKRLSYRLLGHYNQKQWIRYLIIASIIQKEAVSWQQMPLVSSVIYNRLKRDMPLQMDGALNYGIYSHKIITPQRIKSDHTSYNTYLHVGLPKYPVCNVGINAITAAVFPAKTPYLYFMSAKNGRFFFSCNFSTHIHNIKNATK